MQKFEFEKLELEGAYLVKPFCVEDSRGYFIKDYNIEIFNENGIDYDLKEVFYTISKKGVIRAIHFQLNKQQPKLVRCIKGRIFDVIVDLRPRSKTYGEWLSFYLSEDNKLELLIPKYFGHGYLVLDESIVSYKCAEVFFGDGDSGIIYNDKTIGIEWPFELIGGEDKLIISDKDKKLMTFKDYKELVKNTFTV